MNSRKITILSALLMTALASQAQQSGTWIHDTLHTGTGYLNNVYYSLENGIAGNTVASNWHIGLSTSRFSDAIITNSADAGVKLYEITNDTTKFSTNLQADFAAAVTAHPMPFYNSNETWFKGAFNFGSATYGWCEYDMSTHWLKGSVVFGAVVGTDTLQVFVREKQTTPNSSAPVYVIKTAKIDGSNAQTFTINAHTSAGRNFTYLNLVTGAGIEREPLSSQWDFVFSNYNDAAVVFSNQQYKVFGIINNEGLEVAKVDTAESFFDQIDYQQYAYDSVNNSIGRAWKVAGMSGTTVVDSLCYFIRVASGDVWQLAFTDHKSSADSLAPGLVALKKRKVYAAPTDTSTSVSRINEAMANINIAPNPGHKHTRLILNAKKDLDQVLLRVLDFNGRILMNKNMNISAGQQEIAIDASGFATGTYIVELTGSGLRYASPFIKQ